MSNYWGVGVSGELNVMRHHAHHRLHLGMRLMDHLWMWMLHHRWRHQTTCGKLIRKNQANIWRAEITTSRVLYIGSTNFKNNIAYSDILRILRVWKWLLRSTRAFKTKYNTHIRKKNKKCPRSHSQVDLGRCSCACVVSCWSSARRPRSCEGCPLRACAPPAPPPTAHPHYSSHALASPPPFSCVTHLTVSLPAREGHKRLGVMRQIPLQAHKPKTVVIWIRVVVTEQSAWIQTSMANQWWSACQMNLSSSNMSSAVSHLHTDRCANGIDMQTLKVTLWTDRI